ncbi:MAG TPA: DNA repair protein RecN [Verrucomicrobiae bacterium]|jgi:DNA repair protein RecN (Recombination protein N)|nr:DNA repair protein RecN [Verrucomicrobiae bacterium]
MLATLRIKNLALVEDLTLELQPGYNVITGETGAGKSILIGALSLILGERADRTLIRGGSDTCSVEACFDVSRLKAPLAELIDSNGLEPCDEGQLIIKRVFGSSGSNRQFVNGSPASLTVLSRIGEWLVDIHGPHDHQSLLHPARQLAILDSYGGLEGLRGDFGALVRRRVELQREKTGLVVDERTYLQQLELLRFQTGEISAARLQPGEDADVEQQYRRASNSARLLQLSQSAIEAIAEGEPCLLGQAGQLGRTLQDLLKLDPTAHELTQLHEQAVSLLKELQAGVAHYADKVDVDPARLRELEERLNLLQGLKRKYGPGLDEVIAFGEEARNQLSRLEQRDAELGRLNSELEKLDAQLWASAEGLSSRRRQIIPQLARGVSRQLADLGFKQSRFDVSLHTLSRDQFKESLAHAGSNGADSVEFQFAPNPGEPIRPLRAIASSGELARVMLALKTVLAAQDQVPVLVFDEVDANVGGETARTVGQKMGQIAKSRQVLCITHLPQVAAPASAHFMVKKEVRSGRTFSEIVPLDGKERVTELARMLGGQSEAARKHAQAMLAGS